ncbi:extracellular solute-binding protein [Lederbergia galactosidilytica]|nr:extracellular solute-binding protein [Lederbergia galactosidilytica]MBP1915901.1 putative aldouronate transport system substrate-binding protein [Lederbergia galactosidilytica]
MKKPLYGLMILLIIFQTACSKGTESNNVEEGPDENFNETGMPIVNEPITIKMFAGMGAKTQSNWDDILIWNTYEDMTNVHIDWEQVPQEGVDEKRNLALAGGNLPDAFYAANMPTLDIFKYGQQGLFLELNDLIDQYAPNVKKLMEENPEIRKAITFPDGKIYSLPVILDPEFTSVRTHPLPWFNQEVLNKVGMDIPESTDEFYQYLKAVQKETPNMTPFGGRDMNGMIGWLKGSFGVGTTGRDFIDKDPETGDIRFYPITDGYREMLGYLNKLYSEKLIEQNIYTIELANFLANGKDGKYASTAFYAPVELFGEEAGEQYVGGLPLKGPDGEQKFAQVANPVGHIGKFVLTNENPNPAATIRWVDYFYSDEGSRLFYMGVEGETYEVTDDGDYKYVDKITQSEDGISKDEQITNYLAWLGIGAPGILKEKYFDGSEAADQALEAAAKMEPYLIEEAWPPFTYTDEEAKKLAALSADIEKYVNEMQDKFIVGEESFGKWDTFVKNIEKMGLEEYMEIQKTAYERYQNN